jgi:hypothetical protein
MYYNLKFTLENRPELIDGSSTVSAKTGDKSLTVEP